MRIICIIYVLSIEERPQQTSLSLIRVFVDLEHFYVPLSYIWIVFCSYTLIYLAYTKRFGCIWLIALKFNMLHRNGFLKEISSW